MASRDIANMHVFLDLKKKFPHLPDETLRNYLSLFAEDKEKCLSHLQKESEKHYHPSQPFPDFRLPENKFNSIKNDYVKHFVQDSNEDFTPVGNLQHLYIPNNNTNLPISSARSSSHAGILHLPKKCLNQNIISSKPESLSAPVITNSERPFRDIYKPLVSSQATCQLPLNRNSQFIFQTTKNHIIEEPEIHASTAYISVLGEPEQSRKHAVKLSITPSFPFQQQHINVVNNSIYTSHSSRLDHHTTSVNFHLQPQTSSQFPLEISTIPTNLGQPCDSKDFCSHVQISVGDQGATFTAVRLQHPNYSQNESAYHLPITEGCTSSSQVVNSNLSSFPNRGIQQLNSEKSQSFKYPVPGSSDQNQNVFCSKVQPTAQMNSIPSYQSPHDYVLAVKNQQIVHLDLILNELEKEKLVFSHLRTEVEELEEKLLKRNAVVTLPNADELQKLREEVTNLRLEVSCLSVEADNVGENLPQIKERNLNYESQNNASQEDDEEKSQWLCEKCTFANYHALEKCEMCELPKNSDSVQFNSSYSPSTSFQLVSSSKPPFQRAIGSIQISVSRRVPASKSVKLQLTHRLPR